eukprot:TRINITY_DN73220_c0_g1_i1.p1 TRINITY_DN73220_c0_g1~~TRINITY_DN73220_c0_g1_i1.p1  ORF type:complete len:419 (-),score=46.93 TRINITY_DN73220_c0_g1_i1:210-1406(-)
MGGAFGSCLGSCAGSFASASCCALATSGSTRSPKASRCLLVWLQAFAALLSLSLAWNPAEWLGGACNKLSWLGKLRTLGICECVSADSTCWSTQLVYRTQASATLVYILLIIFVVSGCGDRAAHEAPGMKFVGVFVFMVASLILPNAIFGVFGTLANIASGAFLVVQTIPIIDFAYWWNESWLQRGLAARRITFSAEALDTWKIAILFASLILLILTALGTAHLCMTWPQVWWLSISALVITFHLMVLSITEWCEHGSLLTSTFMMAYATWLCYAAVVEIPDLAMADTMRIKIKWCGIAVCAFSLGAFAFMPSLGSTAATEAAVPIAEGDARVLDGVAGIDFIVQCGVHAAASLYVASALVPSASSISFGAHAAAVYVSLLLYAWTLVAPKILTGRSF